MSTPIVTPFPGVAARYAAAKARAESIEAQFPNYDSCPADKLAEHTRAVEEMMRTAPSPTGCCAHRGRGGRVNYGKPRIYRTWDPRRACFVWSCSAQPEGRWGMGVPMDVIRRWREAWRWVCLRNAEAQA